MILLIDNYDSFTYNLVQYLGELNATAIVHRNDSISVNYAITNLRPKAIILSPGPSRPEKAGICLDLTKRAAQENIPLLGVCLGHQTIGKAFGARISVAREIVHGKTSIIYHNSNGLFKNISDPFRATRYHSLIVERKNLPSNLEVTAEIEDGTIMGINHKTAPIFGVQFHPESIASENGHEILKNFLNIMSY